MRAATITDTQLAIEDHEDPVPGAGELLIKVHAAGLNGADMHQLAGHYPAPPGSPQDIPGLELAGEVVDRGPGAERFAVGDRVMSIVGGGGQAELATVNERILMPVPDNLSWVEAGGVPEVFTTAHDAVFTQAGLVVGERLLVHGAAGGVGCAAVRNPELRAGVAELGADVVAPDAFQDRGPFDVILELVGAVNLMDNLKSLATGGRIAVIGTGAGASGEINLGLVMMKRARIHGSTLRARPLELKALTARAMERSVLPLLASGEVTVPIAKTYPLAEAPAAYEHFKAGGKLGKIVLTIDG
jgi:NADPH:quinone reductase